MQKQLLMKSLYSVLLVLAALPAISQTTVVTRDLEVWSALGLETKLHDNFKLSMNQEFRLWQNAQQVDQYFTEVAGKYYAFDKHLRFGLGYRYIRDNNVENGYQNEQRWALDAEYRHKVNRLTLGYRLRSTNRNDVGETTAEGDVPKKNLRLRLYSKYNIKNWKLDPYASVELFRQYESGTDPFYRKLRFTVGTSKKVVPGGTLRGFYRVERDWSEALPNTTGIVGIGFTYKLNQLFKTPSAPAPAGN